ncbi:MAG: 5'-deoxynucleotidase [Pseudohongiella sp.]|nr:5'-deoxynucleotidase [Pseudohongiella sp.]MDO9519309.1 5'-deoxynucleotidase [Pseudohongiella sp.]MDP2126089.1 5'-deoxynucleotidase [Pseudohongiella sp.]
MSESPRSHFFAYISKLRWLQRWGMKRNVINENVMEHSWEVATVTHVLALVKNRYFGGQLDVNAVVVAALYHDCSEVITGDMPSPIKYHSPEITRAYKAIEKQAGHELLNLLPPDLKPDFRKVLIEEELADDVHTVIKSADMICAWLKCKAEVQAGNAEFKKAEEDVRRRLERNTSPEVKYFLETFGPSYSLTLDELLK